MVVKSFQNQQQKNLIENSDIKLRLINKQILSRFTNKIKKCFPTHVGTVLSDRHGFLMHEDIPNKNHTLDENLLALTAVSAGRRIVDLSKYHKIIRSLSRNVKIIILLEKSRNNYLNYGKFEKILQRENPV